MSKSRKHPKTANFRANPSFGKDLTERQWNDLLQDVKYRYYPVLFIYFRDKGICHLCGKFVPFNEATRDHIIPHATFKAEKNTYKSEEHYRRAHFHNDNMKLAHHSCNNLRGNMSIEDWRLNNP